MTKKEELKGIEFSHYYGKLREGAVFTTVRTWRHQKDLYYRSGQTYEVRLRLPALPDKAHPRVWPLGRAVLLQVVRLNSSSLSQPFLDYDTDRGKYTLPAAKESMLMLFRWVDGIPPSCVHQVGGGCRNCGGTGAVTDPDGNTWSCPWCVEERKRTAQEKREAVGGM